MPKRFFDTEIFGDPWFQELKPADKCLWFYLLSTCNHAGICKFSEKMAHMLIGGKFNIENLNNGKVRVAKLTDEKYFIVDFVKFQYNIKSYEDLSDHHKVQSSAKTILEKANILNNGYLDTLNIPLGKGNDTLSEDNKNNELSKVKYPPEVEKLYELFVLTLDGEQKRLIPDSDKLRNQWKESFEKCHRLDGIEYWLIADIVDTYRNDEQFWRKNFTSPMKLRSKDKYGRQYIHRFIAEGLEKDQDWHKPDIPDVEYIESLIREWEK